MTYKPNELTRWTQVATVEECPPSTAREVVVNGSVVALLNVEGVFYALDGVCPHQGGPLGQGTLDGCSLTCPWHGLRINVATGQHETTPFTKHTTFATRVSDNIVYVSTEAQSDD